MNGELIMKRLITFAIAAITAVCLFSCAVTGGDKTSKPNGLGSHFQAAASVVLGDLEAEGTVKRFGDGMWEIEFSSPNTLAGIKLEFNDGSVDASYKGLSFSVPQSALPVKAMMLNLISAVDSTAGSEQLTGTEENGLLKISGTLDGGDYELTVDENGDLASFAMPNNKLTMNFSDVTPIDTDTESTTAAEETTSAEETASAEETTAAEEAAT